MIDLLFLVLTFIGSLYLILVMFIAFKERAMIVGLVFVNIIIFIYTFFFAPELIERFALSGYKVFHGQGYTIMTYMFLHASIPHLFLNALALMFFGYHMEKEISGPPTLMVFIISGFIAGIAFILTSPATALVVGASGGVFGLMAYLTMMRPFKISPMPFLIPMPICVASVLYVILAAPVVMAGSFPGGIAHNAHLGGLLAGALLAIGMNRQQALKGLAIVLVIAALTIILPPLFM